MCPMCAYSTPASEVVSGFLGWALLTHWPQLLFSLGWLPHDQICSPELSFFFFCIYFIEFTFLISVPCGLCERGFQSPLLQDFSLEVQATGRQAQICRAVCIGVLGTNSTNKKWVLYFVWLCLLVYTSLRDSQGEGPLTKSFCPQRHGNIYLGQKLVCSVWSIFVVFGPFGKNSSMLSCVAFLNKL